MRRHSRRSFSKGFRDIFGGHKKSAEEDMEKEAAQDEEQDEVSTGSEMTEQAEAPEADCCGSRTVRGVYRF